MVCLDQRLLGPTLCSVYVTLRLIKSHCCSYTYDVVYYCSHPHSEGEEEALDMKPSFEVEMVTHLQSDISAKEDLITSMTQ